MSLSYIEDAQNRDAWWRWFTRLFYAIPKVQTFNPTLTPSAVGANSESVQTFTITGLTTDDIMAVNKPTNQSGLDMIGYWVSTTNTLSIKYRNVSGGSITPTSEAYRVLAVRI
jgi:hypothetical protein